MALPISERQQPAPPQSHTVAPPEDTVIIEGSSWKVVKGTPLICDICKERVATTTTQCLDITHGICQPCDSQITDRRCSHCRASITNEDTLENVSKNLVQLANKLTLSCTEPDCQWQGSYGDASKHGASRENHIYQCPNHAHGCSEKGTQVDLQEHQLSCIYNTEQCTNCDSSYIKSQRADHLEHCLMMPETCAVTLLRSQWKALESVLDERTPLSALSDSKKLAESIRNRQIMDSPCSYGCGFYSDALNTLGDHYKICPETPVKCNNDCGEQIARKSLLDHNKHCDHVEQECHRGCGARVIRKRLLSGEHDKTCPKLTIPCNYCQKSFERQEISLHERTCHNRPAPCRYCGKKMLFSESKTHLDHCDKTMPFTLTDHTYIIQPESTGLVFQREGEAVCSHICIRESAHILNSWMSGRSGEMRMNLGILDKKELTFSLGNNITTLMLDDASLKIFSDSYNISNFEVFCINENGNKLFTLYSSDAREAQVCKSRVDLSHSCVLLTREILAKQPQHDILYLIISLRSHTTLFPAKAKQLQDKQATPQKKSWWSR